MCWPGPLFPLRPTVLRVGLIWCRSLPWWAGAMLTLGGIAYVFEPHRSFAMLAHGIDCLVLVPLVYLPRTWLRPVLGRRWQTALRSQRWLPRPVELRGRVRMRRGAGADVERVRVEVWLLVVRQRRSAGFAQRGASLRAGVWNPAKQG
jgi:hypothetical protein